MFSMWRFLCLTALVPARLSKFQHCSKPYVPLVPSGWWQISLHRLEGASWMAKVDTYQTVEKSQPLARGTWRRTWEHFGEGLVPPLQSWRCPHLLCEFVVLPHMAGSFCPLAGKARLWSYTSASINLHWLMGILPGLGHWFLSAKAGSNIPSRLQGAYHLFKAYCRSIRATPMIKNFTKENMGWTSLAKFPESSCKGSDCRLLLGFLVDFMYHDRTYEVNSICHAAVDAVRSMDDCMRLLFTANRTFLTRAEGLAAFNLLEVWHVKTHACARGCYDQSLCFFNLTPKFHYLQHVSSDVKAQLDAGHDEILNPALFATQMAEEYIGKSCQVARTTHPCTAVQRTAQKWLVFCKQWWDADVCWQQKNDCLLSAGDRSQDNDMQNTNSWHRNMDRERSLDIFNSHITMRLDSRHTISCCIYLDHNTWNKGQLYIHVYIYIYIYI